MEISLEHLLVPRVAPRASSPPCVSTVQWDIRPRAPGGCSLEPPAQRRCLGRPWGPSSWGQQCHLLEPWHTWCCGAGLRLGPLDQRSSTDGASGDAAVAAPSPAVFYGAPRALTGRFRSAASSSPRSLCPEGSFLAGLFRWR